MVVVGNTVHDTVQHRAPCTEADFLPYYPLVSCKVSEDYLPPLLSYIHPVGGAQGEWFYVLNA